mgnify:FL=1
MPNNAKTTPTANGSTTTTESGENATSTNSPSPSSETQTNAASTRTAGAEGKTSSSTEIITTPTLASLTTIISEKNATPTNSRRVSTHTTASTSNDTEKSATSTATPTTIRSSTATSAEIVTSTRTYSANTDETTTAASGREDGCELDKSYIVLIIVLGVLIALLLIFVAGLVCKVLKQKDGRKASIQIEQLIGLKANEDEETEQVPENTEPAQELVVCSTGAAESSQDRTDAAISSTFSAKLSQDPANVAESLQGPTENAKSSQCATEIVPAAPVVLVALEGSASSAPPEAPILHVTPVPSVLPQGATEAAELPKNPPNVASASAASSPQGPSDSLTDASLQGLIDSIASTTLPSNAPEAPSDTVYPAQVDEAAVSTQAPTDTAAANIAASSDPKNTTNQNQHDDVIETGV